MFPTPTKALQELILKFRETESVSGLSIFGRQPVIIQVAYCKVRINSDGVCMALLGDVSGDRSSSKGLLFCKITNKKHNYN